MPAMADKICEASAAGSIIQDEKFHFADGNVHVLANKQIMFCVHKFMLEDFSGLKAKLNTDQNIGLIDLPDKPHDLRNTFLIIYSYPPKPLIFSVKELVSALRIATKYNHPTLREFVIHKLELQGLPSLEYLPLARECNVRKWEKLVVDQLAARTEPLTLAEAEYLGMDQFVSLAARREAKPPRPPKHSIHPALVPFMRGAETREWVSKVAKAAVPQKRGHGVASSASGAKRRLIGDDEENLSDMFSLWD
ncbi:hypothetical protein BDV93DRAFT_545485 [Ceratobasidium sp. AG-I]|nr:hypothetical protein BDV93DRAFT_545485 [Ceratobasidium sp. AG-I]